MGYTTGASGQLQLSRKLTEAEAEYLGEWLHRRHVIVPFTWEGRPDPRRTAAGFPIGDQGVYYTGDATNLPFGGDGYPTMLPGWNCPLMLDNDDPDIDYLAPDGSDRVHDLTEWVLAVRDLLLKPLGVHFEVSELRWRGSDFQDVGRIKVSEPGYRVWEHYGIYEFETTVRHD